MRIIAGQYKGRKLATPANDAIRPTSDRTRESVFNLLMHGAYAGEAILDQHVVDLCCGTGAMGLEALSRGARMATFIDKDKRSLELARQNVTHCGANNAAQFVQSDAAKLPMAKEKAALVMMDAPYDQHILAAAYASLRVQQWLADGALIVAEQAVHTDVPALDGAELIDDRKYGKTRIVIYQLKGI